MEMNFDDLTWASIGAIFSQPKLYIYLLVVMAGTFIHAVQKAKLQKAGDGTIWSWFSQNRKATAWSFLGAFCGFVYLYNEGSIDLVAYFGMGYMSDSFFNRAKGMLGIQNVNVAHSGGE